MAFTESVVLADATQGGIPLQQALSLTSSERRAAIEVVKEIRKKDKEDIEKNTK